MFHNTIETTGTELRRLQANVARQEDIVFAYFWQGGEYTPSEVWTADVLPGSPLTSVRRAITDLTDIGKLEKTTKQRKGLYGKPEFVWRIPGGQGELF